MATVTNACIGQARFGVAGFQMGVHLSYWQRILATAYETSVPRQTVTPHKKHVWPARITEMNNSVIVRSNPFSGHCTWPNQTLSVTVIMDTSLFWLFNHYIAWHAVSRVILFLIDADSIFLTYTVNSTARSSTAYIYMCSGIIHVCEIYWSIKK